MSDRILRKVRTVFLSVSFVVAPIVVEVALAAGGGDHDVAGHGGGHAGIETLFYPLVNFVLFVGILVFAYRKVGKARLIEQHKDVKEYLKRAADDLGSAESMFNRAQQRLAVIGEEKQELIAALNREGETLSETVLEKAEQAVENSLLDTKRRIDNEVARAETELRHEVVRQATAIAREKVVERLSSDDDARLRREAIQRIG